LLPVILLTGAAIPGIPVKEFAPLLCMELGLMGVITPFADAASPVYANSGYLPPKSIGVSVRPSAMSPVESVTGMLMCGLSVSFIFVVGRGATELWAEGRHFGLCNRSRGHGNVVALSSKCVFQRRRILPAAASWQRSVC
jgi:hypothetical protein